MATNVLVLGAGGAIAQHVINSLKDDTNLALTLFARKESQLVAYRTIANLLTGDALNPDDVNKAIKGQEVVYANLAGAVDRQAERIIAAMKANDVKRLLFVTSLGIYDEVPGAFGKWNNAMIGSALKTYRKAADLIEASGLDYTIIRPAWLQDEDEVDYETTQKGEPFKGTEVSRKSVGNYIASIILDPKKDSCSSVGINKPGTDGDRPSFY